MKPKTIAVSHFSEFVAKGSRAEREGKGGRQTEKGEECEEEEAI